ncbi:hypothetical protein TNCV_3229301 [Trichonephila clavipes]|nr:hypothetical protein TNCV_3229301 [Trichonephila clavipes]
MECVCTRSRSQDLWYQQHMLLHAAPSILRGVLPEPLGKKTLACQMNSLAASVKLTYSASMVDRLTDFCLKVRHEIGVSSIKVMNPPIDTRSSLFVAKSESE